jgi:hypothetical protein
MPKSTSQKMTPKRRPQPLLETINHGRSKSDSVIVYIRRSPVDGSVYATTLDFSKYIMEPPLEVVRVPTTDRAAIACAATVSDDLMQDILNTPSIIKKLKKYAR